MLRAADECGYMVGELVGAGGMGVVYRASHPTTQSPVVVKFLRSELAADPVVRARFAAEIRAVRRLCHPNLARFVDAADGFLVMDVAPGRPLGVAIAEAGPFA